MSAVVPSSAVESLLSASRFTRVFTTSIGQKLVMAVTGVILTLFVLGHMLGNLTAFQGADAINTYAVTFRKVPAALWAVRVGLLVAALLHIWSYLVLTKTSWSARSQGYQVTAWKESSLASRTMRWTGPILAVFIIYHLLHMTLGLPAVHPTFRHMETGKAYAYENLVSGLSNPLVAGFYLLATLALALHLFHGVWSMFQTLGISQPRYESAARKFATAFTVVVCGGFALVPLAILAGFLK